MEKNHRILIKISLILKYINIKNTNELFFSQVSLALNMIYMEQMKILNDKINWVI